MQLFRLITLILCTSILTSLPSHAGGPHGRAILKMLQANKVFQKIPVSAVRRRAYIERRAHMYEVSNTFTPAKKVLNAQLHYRRELQAVVHLYKQIQQASPLSSNLKLLRLDIEKTIVNKTLRESLLNHLEHSGVSSMIGELEDYYHLAPDHIPTFRITIESSETFARNALAFLRKHPYKPNWPLRHILKTEGIDPALKEEIRNIIGKGYVLADQENHVLKLLQEAYEQYQRILKESAQDETVEATVAIYEYLANELETFTTKNQRPPVFRQANEEERDLFNLITVLVYHHEANVFEQVIPHIRRLYELLERFPSPRYEETQTVRELTKFIQEYNTFPQSVHMRDFLHPRPNEDLLYESILYWKQNSTAFQEELNTIFLRHTTRTEYLPRPFNYY